MGFWRIATVVVGLGVLFACGGSDDPLVVDRSCPEGQHIGLDGDCAVTPDDMTVFSVSSSDVTMDVDASSTPDEGNEVVGGTHEGLAEACCIFAVWSNGAYYTDQWGNMYFTGACTLPEPWTPGAWGCGCVGNNAVVDAWTGQTYWSVGSWIGFTCMVD